MPGPQHTGQGEYDPGSVPASASVRVPGYRTHHFPTALDVRSHPKACAQGCDNELELAPADGEHLAEVVPVAGDAGLDDICVEFVAALVERVELLRR